MTQAHPDLQSQLDSQNISDISDPSTTPLCNTSPISFLSPTKPEPTNNRIEQMDTTIFKSSGSDHNDKANLLNHLHLHLLHRQKRNMTLRKILSFLPFLYIRHSFLQKTQFQHKEM